MNDLMNIDRSLLSLSQYKLVSVFLFSSDAFVQTHTYIYNMYTWSYKKLNFKCCSRKRERERERGKKLGLMNKQKTCLNSFILR